MNRHNAVRTTLLLAAMLGLERMFAADYEDGSLEQFALSPLPLTLRSICGFCAQALTGNSVNKMIAT